MMPETTIPMQMIDQTIRRQKGVVRKNKMATAAANINASTASFTQEYIESTASTA
jgi:hypothetical protein